MLSHTKIKSLSNKIGLKETWEVFDYSQSRNTFIKISLPSFFWSRDALLYDTNQTLQNIKIYDILGNKALIMVHQHV